MTTISSATPQLCRPSKGLAALLDFAEISHRRAAALLVLVSLVAFLPGFFQIPPVDRDEAYYAQATKQMVETGNYLDIHYQNDVRYRKPIGIYWLQAAVVDAAQSLGMAGAPATIWLYRLPSLLGSVGAVLAIYWCALAFVARRGALLAGLMMAGSAALGVEARLAKTDAVLLLTVVVAMGVLARAYLQSRAASRDDDVNVNRLHWPLPAMFWTAIAAGILAKGPLIVMVVGLTAGTVSIFDRSARWLTALRPLPGVAWMLLLALPWFVAIDLRTGDAFLVHSLGHDMLAKIVGGQESHGAPPGAYLLLFFVTFFPASTLAPIALPGIWAARREAVTGFLLAWLVPSWIVLELVATKLPNYVLPLYPAIAVLLAGAIETKTLSNRPELTRAAAWWFVFPLIASGLAIAASVIVDGNLVPAAWPFLTAAVVCGFYAWRSYADDGAERAFLRGFVAAICAVIGIYSIVLPSLTPLFPSVPLAEILRHATCANPRAASAGYEEPSLVFLAGTDTQLTDGPGAADFLRRGGCRFAFVDARDQAAFERRAAAVGLHYKAGSHIKGINVSNGQWLDIGVFQPAGAP
jgi:4-amino-4-deoxy-L-arabinose transferase-like glycosyltransferase